MSKTENPFSAGIVDFNTRTMTPEAIKEQGIPLYLQPYIADLRQYPLKIAEFLPEGTLWFNQEQPWNFRAVMQDEDKVKRLRDSSILILSGSGMSAYKFQEGKAPADPPNPKDEEYLIRAENLVRDHLGEGKWVLGDCFGGQLAMHAVGGRLGRLPSNEYGNAVTEAGYLPHLLTPQGRTDEVFGHLPDIFYAAHFHNDFVKSLPEVGSKIPTGQGEIEVVRAEILAVRNGFLSTSGIENEDTQYIHGALVEFSNGARLYHIQPHPEMSTPQRANFFARYVEEWLSNEEQMGPVYAKAAKEIPQDADYNASQIITNFALAYMNHLNREILQVTTPAIIQQLYKYALN